MNLHPGLILHEDSIALDVEKFVEVKPKRIYVKKNKLFTEKDNIEIKKGGLGQNQVPEEEALVNQTRKYVKKSKVLNADKATQAPNNEEFSPSSPENVIEGVGPGCEEEEEEVGGKRDLDDKIRERSKKFEHVFVSGFNSMAIDNLEFHKLVRKLIRAKARKEQPQGWAGVCFNYKIIINAELRAVNAELEVMKTIITRGDGHMPMKRRIPEGLANVVVLALEALEEVSRLVSKTWKNAHAIFLNPKKSLQDMGYFVGYMEFRRQDPEYWWSKTGGFALEDIPSGKHRPLGEIMHEDEKGNLKIDGDKSEGKDLQVEDVKHLKEEEEFENDFEEYLGQEYRELVGSRLDFSSCKACWWE